MLYLDLPLQIRRNLQSDVTSSKEELTHRRLMKTVKTPTKKKIEENQRGKTQ